jgi:hypothetical protein
MRSLRAMARFFPRETVDRAVAERAANSDDA